MSRDSFLNGPAAKKHPSYNRSKKQESELAALVKGRRTAASGSKDEKADVRKKGLIRIEAKTTSKKSFSVTLEMIHVLEEAALSGAETPCLVIEMNDGGVPVAKKLAEVAIIPIAYLEEITK